MSGLGRLFGRGEPGEARRREVRAAGGVRGGRGPGPSRRPRPRRSEASSRARGPCLVGAPGSGCPASPAAEGRAGGRRGRERRVPAVQAGGRGASFRLPPSSLFRNAGASFKLARRGSEGVRKDCLLKAPVRWGRTSKNWRIQCRVATRGRRCYYPPGLRRSSVGHGGANKGQVKKGLAVLDFIL